MKRNVIIRMAALLVAFATTAVLLMSCDSEEETTVHTFGEWISDGEVNHKRTCECGETETAAHTWSDGIMMREATHLAEGEKAYICMACGATKVEKIEKLKDHTFGEWTSVDETSHTRTCECGETETAAHTWSDGIVTQEATHLAEGEKAFVCMVCSATKTEKIEKLKEHTFGAWTSVDETNHARTCECGETETAAHAWNDGVTTKEATHLAEGEKIYTCAVCGVTKTEKIEKLKDHAFGAWAIVDETSHKRICACGATEKVAHNYDNDQDATCNECGYIRTVVWNGSIADGFESGNGTESNPYIITAASQLAYLAKQVNSGTSYGGCYFKLANDLYFNDTTNWGSWDKIAPKNTWTAIGASSKIFSGTFDGDTHVIYGIYIDNSNAERQGLFGCSYGIIQNLGVEKSYICGKQSIGGVCGYSGGTITNCHNTGMVSGSSEIGGVCGENYTGTITNCYNMGAVSGSGWEIGGVCGYNCNGTTSNCYNTGVVSGYRYVGGVCGYNYNGTTGNCYNTGMVSGSAERVGGVCGWNAGTVTSCYNTGAVSGSKAVGGVCGNDVGIIKDCYNIGAVSGNSSVGGVCGSSIGTIIRCYNTGAVGGASTSVGGVCGYGGTKVNCYYLTGGVKDSNATELSDAQMKTKASFVGFDFENVWKIDAGSYPTLR